MIFSHSDSILWGLIALVVLLVHVSTMISQTGKRIKTFRSEAAFLFWLEKRRKNGRIDMESNLNE
jgi:hypothetical protein